MARAFFQIDFPDRTMIREEAYRVVSARPQVSRKVGKLVGGLDVVAAYSDPVWMLEVEVGPLTQSESDKLREHVGSSVTATFSDAERPASRWREAELWQNATFAADLLDARPKALGPDITRGDRWRVKLQAPESAFLAPAPLATVDDRPAIYPVRDFSLRRGQSLVFPVGVYYAAAGTVEVSVTGLPAGLSWSASAGAIVGTVDPNAPLRAYTVRVVARVAGTQVVSSLTFVLTVVAGQVVFRLGGGLGSTALKTGALTLGQLVRVRRAPVGAAALRAPALDLAVFRRWRSVPVGAAALRAPALALRATRRLGGATGAVAMAAPALEIASVYFYEMGLIECSVEADLGRVVRPVHGTSFGAIEGSMASGLRIGYSPGPSVEIAAFEASMTAFLARRFESGVGIELGGIEGELEFTLSRQLTG